MIDINKIKEEFLRDFEIDFDGRPCFTRGEVIDWWLSKLSQALETRNKELVEKIKDFAIMKGSVIDKLEEKTDRERTTNLLNENLEVGYRQSCIDIITLLQSK